MAKGIDPGLAGAESSSCRGSAETQGCILKTSEREQGRFYIVFGAMSGARPLKLHLWLARKRGLHDGFGRFHGCQNAIARFAAFAAQERVAHFCAVSAWSFFLRVVSFVGVGCVGVCVCGGGGGAGGGGG